MSKFIISVSVHVSVTSVNIPVIIACHVQEEYPFPVYRNTDTIHSHVTGISTNI